MIKPLYFHKIRLMRGEIFMKHYSSYLYHIQASHSTITSYKQQGRENEWQRMGVEKTKKKRQQRSGTEHINYSKTRKTGADSKAPIKESCWNSWRRNHHQEYAERYIFARHSVFIIKATYFPVYKNNTTNNVKNTTELKNIYSVNKYMSKWLRKNTQW